MVYLAILSVVLTVATSVISMPLMIIPETRFITLVHGRADFWTHTHTHTLTRTHARARARARPPAVSSKVGVFSLRLKKSWSCFQTGSCRKQRVWLFIAPLLHRFKLIDYRVNAANRGLRVVSWCGEVDDSIRTSFSKALFLIALFH